MLVEIVRSLINDSQVFWLQKDFGGVEKSYEGLLAMVESVRKLNANFDKLESIDFEVKDLENEREEDEEPPRKKRRISANPSEMTELRETVLKPVKIDKFSMIHLMTNIQDMTKHSAKAEKWIKDAGGIQKIEEKINSLISNEKSANSVKYDKIERDFIEKMEELIDFKDKCSKIVKKLVEWHEMYRNKEDIGRRLREKMREEHAPIFEDLSFWPIFEEPRKYFEDNYHHVDDKKQKPRKEFPNWLNILHDRATCMGNCDFKFEHLYPTYKIATDFRIYENVLDYLKLVEVLSNELMNDFRELMENSANFETINNVFPCQHLSGPKIHHDESRRKADKNRLKCAVCRLSHTLESFRFAIGTNSFHGYRKKMGNLAIVRLMDLIWKEERLVKLEDFGIFEKYFSALNEFANSLQSHLNDFLKYEVEKRRAFNRKTLFDLRNETERYVDATNESRWMKWYNEMIKTAHTKNAEIFKSKIPELKQNCNDLAYFLNVFHQQNSSETKNDENVNCCPICCRVFDCLAIFPCAHQVCQSCFEHLKNLRPNSNSISCSHCRRDSKFDEIMIARQPKNVFSGKTKLKKTIELIRKIVDDDQKNQIVLFTNFTAGEEIWNFIAEYLRKSELPLIEENRVDFRKLENSRILLSSTSSLFPVFATHAIFLDLTATLTSKID